MCLKVGVGLGETADLLQECLMDFLHGARAQTRKLGLHVVEGGRLVDDRRLFERELLVEQQQVLDVLGVDFVFADVRRQTTWNLRSMANRSTALQL